MTECGLFMARRYFDPTACGFVFMVTIASMDARKLRFRLWRWIAIAFVALAIGLAIGIPVWLGSTSDIDDFQARAKAQGIASTWEEVATERPLHPGRTAIFDQLVELVGALESWEDGEYRVRFGEALPDDLRDHYRGYGPEFWDDFSILVLQLGGRPVIVHQTVSALHLLPEVALFRRLSGIAREAWLLGMIEAEVLLELPDLLEANSLFAGLVRDSIRKVALRSLMDRSPSDLSDRALARISAWSSQTGIEVESMLRYEFLTLVTGVRELSQVEPGRAARKDMKITGLWTLITIRWSRPASLELLAELCTVSTASRSLGEQHSALQAFDDRIAALADGPARHRYALALKLLPSLRRFQEKLMETALMSQLVLCEHGRAPWPDDPFVLPGTSLYRHERDGVLIGAWSVGPDGVDNGGERLSDDFRVMLRSPWDAP